MGSWSARSGPWKPRLPLPQRRPNGAERLADGTLLLERASVVRSLGPAPFLAQAIAADAFRVELEVRADARHQYGPARILTISRDPWRRDLSITQWRDHLGVRMRRPGASKNGVPELAFEGRIFAQPDWHAIVLELDQGFLSLDLDGTRVYGEHVGPGALARWDPELPVALGDELTGLAAVARPGAARRLPRRRESLGPARAPARSRSPSASGTCRSPSARSSSGARSAARATSCSTSQPSPRSARRSSSAGSAGRGSGGSFCWASARRSCSSSARSSCAAAIPALADALPNTLGLVAGALVTARLLARRRARAAPLAR